MSSTMRKRATNRRGVATVEFAVVAPVLFLFIFAIFEFGRAFMVMNLMGDAVRVGCREGAVQGKSSATIQTDVQNRLSGEGINNTTVTVQVNGATGDPSVRFKPFSKNWKKLPSAAEAGLKLRHL